MCFGKKTIIGDHVMPSLVVCGWVYFPFVFLFAGIAMFLSPCVLAVFCVVYFHSNHFYYLVPALIVCTLICSVYFVWIFICDYGPKNGGRALKCFKYSAIWKYFVRYFPMYLHTHDSSKWNGSSNDIVDDQTLDANNVNQNGLQQQQHQQQQQYHSDQGSPTSVEDLNTRDHKNRKYIFVYHPHGIASMAAFGNFATEANDFSRKFPSIKLHVLSLVMHYKIPFFREYLMALGLSDVSSVTCRNILRKGESIMIVVGGAAEALNAHEGTMDLVLKKRKGFVKIALQEGAHLVPVLSFGENDIFYQIQNPKGGLLRRFQEFLMYRFTFSLPLFCGNCFCIPFIGIMPQRRPIHTVVGNPVSYSDGEEIKIANPTRDQINSFHEKYCDSLQELYAHYKGVYAQKRKNSLKII